MSRSNLFTVALLGAFAAGGIQRVAAQSCSVSASAAAFGQYDPQAVASTDTTATVTVAYKQDVQYVTVKISMS
jgi:hypothetical protein